jgi:hypothetical protein
VKIKKEEEESESESLIKSYFDHPMIFLLLVDV